MPAQQVLEGGSSWWAIVGNRAFLTGCIKEFSEVENYIENVMKTTNPIGKFYALKSVIKVKVFLLCHSLFLEIFDFHYPFQGIESANGICSFHYIFYIVFYPRKFFYAPCAYSGCGHDRLVRHC